MAKPCTGHLIDEDGARIECEFPLGHPSIPFGLIEPAEMDNPSTFEHAAPTRGAAWNYDSTVHEQVRYEYVVDLDPESGAFIWDMESEAEFREFNDMLPGQTFYVREVRYSPWQKRSVQ